MFVSERASAVTLPARSNDWLMEPATPRLIDVGRLASSYASVSVRLEGKDWVASRPSSRYERVTVPVTYVSGGSMTVWRGIGA